MTPMIIFKNTRLALLASTICILAATPAQPSDLNTYARQTEAALAASGVDNGAGERRHRCFPKIEGEAEAHIIATYRGGAKVDNRLKSHPPRYMDVVVRATKKPALLILSAYEPVVWNLKIEDDADIAGVYLNGYQEQMIDGLPDGTPIGRTIYELRNGERDKKCFLKPTKQAKSSASASELVAKTQLELRTIYQGQKREHSLQTERLKKIRWEVGVLGKARLRLAREGNDQASLETIDSMIAERTAEIQTITPDLGHIFKTVVDTEKKLQAHRKTNRARLREKKRPTLSAYSNLRLLPRLAELETAISEQGAFTVADYKLVDGRRNGLVMISQRSSDAFLQRRKSGRDQLASLVVPNIPNMPAGTKLGQLEDNLTSRGNLEALVKQGFLYESPEVWKYYCDRLSATSLAIGGTVRTCKPYKGKTYTIVGPVRFPKRLCQENKVRFFLAADVAFPKGARCRNAVLRLSEAPCFEESSVCRSRRIFQK